MVVEVRLGLVGQAHGGHLLKRAAFTHDLAAGLFLSRAHRAVVVLARDQHEEHEEDGQQRVEVVRNGLYKRGEAVFAQVTANRNGPRGHRRDDAHRGSRGVDDPCQLFVADAELVGDGTHNGADRQAVEVVVHEDDDAKQRREHLGHLRVLDVGGYPLRICAAAARRGDDHGQRAQQRKE